MKKAGYCLIVASLVVTGVLCGFLWGRNSASGEINLTGNVSPAIPENEAEATLSSNTHTTPKQKININTATHEELCSIPGIGSILAQRIITYREQNGPFTCIEALDAVPGIDHKTVEKILQYITTGGTL